MSVQQQPQQQQSMMTVQQNNVNVTPFHTASLYVGDLDPEITETSLFEIFNQVGPVASIRVCRDTVTRKSLGYSYVNFHNVADAERALDTMNFSLIKGNPCRIMWSQRDPSMRRSGVGNVFVKNLDESVDNKALYDTFSLFGNILSCKVAIDENSESKGYGYVHYETAESANEAISRIDGMMIAGKQVHVGHFVRRNDRVGQAEWTNIYVKNIPLAWDEQKLREEFGKFGTITSIKIQSESSENGIVSKGFGFINFEEHTAADEAIKTMDGIDVSEKKESDEVTEEGSEEPQKLFCCRAQKKNERQRELQQKFEAIKSERLNKYQGINVFVKNLDDSVTDEKLNKMFSEYGTITSARIMKDPATSESKGFGFVCFSSPMEASKAVQEMNNKLIGSKPIYVALAQRREARRAQLEAQFARGSMGPRGTPMGAMQGGIYGMTMPYMMAGQPMPQPNQQQQLSQHTNRQGPGGYPMMPQMMQARGTPRAQTLPNYQNRGAYPIPAYAMRGMQNTQSRRVNSAGANAPSGQRANSMGAVQSMQAKQIGMPQSMGGPMNISSSGTIGRNQGAGMSMSQRGPPAGMSSHPQRQGSNIKYSQQVRNSSLQQGGGPLGAMMGGGGNIGGGMMMGPQGPENLTAQALAAASPELQKNMIGERLYPLIHEIKPDLAGKITGMLLEMDNSELLHLLESPESLKAKIQEAMFVLEAHASD
eukprot:CAMPEP_0171461106 /NCGR_PEP_ID=MMETSP0945-20130129/5693_1 /TAXON_ID=109269 /ORGANISM="Vaucheria litorea, Strain CCMP2940" /LENGTH=707 /DNA_ID=CAMNT_0011987399 /DNA_START=173 /DNA_END=2296 /DNA_ORIENTATION=+